MQLFILLLHDLIVIQASGKVLVASADAELDIFV